MTSPWSTEAGRGAREAQLRLLAQDKGFAGEFAREVLAGRANLHAILRQSIVPEDALGSVRAAAERWNALPDEEKRTLVHEWDDTTARTIEALNAIARPEPKPPENHEDETWWKW
ncbi:hypothetical protein KIPE111705_29285 [Kibdelosporangium persicum]|uniref:Uncharacterized protein n=1 Tax=Kibdelosporangium persicum TaxID=2698649 RepID=A0ABX2F0M7_9PSEU|nr:hypothetical protein [Kibdelosporangium persicum]NRN64502.1 hypothetical protein [Kibdelosporangium persicum]